LCESGLSIEPVLAIIHPQHRNLDNKNW